MKLYLLPLALMLFSCGNDNSQTTESPSEQIEKDTSGKNPTSSSYSPNRTPLK